MDEKEREEFRREVAERAEELNRRSAYILIIAAIINIFTALYSNFR